MARVNELMEGRNQGMVLALKIAKEQGIEALEKEIQYRNITGVSMKLTKAEMNAATTRMKIHSTKMAIAISLITLVDEFGMGKMQARKFKETFDRRVDEICDDILYRIVDKDSLVCAYDDANGTTVFVDTVLNQNIMDGLKATLVETVETEKNIKVQELQSLIKKSIVVEKGDIIPENNMAVSPKPAGKKVVELDLNQVRDMYVNKGLSLKSIADELGCAASTVHSFIKKNKITKEEVKAKTETSVTLTVELVRELYTEGSMNLSDTAKYFRVDSKVLHSFIEKHGLKKKVVKPNDPFLDANKMGKEDFRKQMLAARK